MYEGPNSKIKKIFFNPPPWDTSKKYFFEIGPL